MVEDSDIFWCDAFVGSSGGEVDCCDAALSDCLRLIEGRGVVPAGGLGISGTPKAAFTLGALSTAKVKIWMEIYKELQRNLEKIKLKIGRKCKV